MAVIDAVRAAVPQKQPMGPGARLGWLRAGGDANKLVPLCHHRGTEEGQLSRRDERGAQGPAADLYAL